MTTIHTQTVVETSEANTSLYSRLQYTQTAVEPVNTSLYTRLQYASLYA